MFLKRHILLAVSAFAILTLSVCAYANHDSDEKDHHEQSGKKSHDKDGSGSHLQSPQLVTNKQYDSTCGSCHWAYIPQLLPSESWDSILGSLNNHFGSEVPVTDQELAQIKEYLLTNSADKTDMKIGRKIAKSLAGKPPLRITDVQYIRHKHSDISPVILKRKSIQSLANCIACHPSASTADFKDDNVRIPLE